MHRNRMWKSCTMKNFDKFMLLFVLLSSNEKHQLLSPAEFMLLSKIYGNMQTLPMIDLVYNTLTTVVPSSHTPLPYNPSNHSTLPTSSPHWLNSHSPFINNRNNNNLYNLDKHQVLLGSGSLNFSNNISNYNNITGGGGGAASGGNDGSYINGTYVYDDDGSDSDVHKEFIFDRTDVRVIFITLYSLVFCCCFFGKWGLINGIVVFLVIYIGTFMTTGKDNDVFPWLLLTHNEV